MTKREDIKNIAQRLFENYKYTRELRQQTKIHMQNVYKALIQVYMLGFDDGVECYQNYIEKRKHIEERML